MSALYYHQIVVYILALLPSSLTQLTGSITTTDNRFVITISISNPTYNTISILKSNNVFDDQLDLPVSFTVKDDEGNEAPFATTYAMRSGISNNDLYVLKPGQTFSRIYDIRQFLQSIPSVKHGLYTKTIQIIPPATFQGVMSNGPYNVPAEAAADLSSGTLGNFAAARLIDIRLQAKVLLTAHNFPIYQNPDPETQFQLMESNWTLLAAWARMQQTCPIPFLTLAYMRSPLSRPPKTFRVCCSLNSSSHLKDCMSKPPGIWLPMHYKATVFTSMLTAVTFKICAMLRAVY